MEIKFIKPSFEINMQGETGIEKLKRIEKAARLCYNSLDKITENSYEKFIKMLISKGHESTLEHASFSVKFKVSRSFSHQLVRHRIASVSQASQRYINYIDSIEYIIPPWCNIEPFTTVIPQSVPLLNKEYPQESLWITAVCNSSEMYRKLINGGWRAEQARSVLSNSTATELVFSANLREWRNVFKLRAHAAADPCMREIMEPLLVEANNKIPIVFEDCFYKKVNDNDWKD